jgi:hypothetical protein
MSDKTPPLPESPTASVCGSTYRSHVAYNDLPASVYEYVAVPSLKAAPFPLEMYANGILKVPTKELNSSTYVMTKNICGLHFVGNRLSIQTSLPCQGELSHIMFICPTDTKQKVVEFILRIIQNNIDINEGLQ